MIPQMVPNRVLQLDGDMLCYECGHDDSSSFAQCTLSFETALKTRMAMAGAEYCNIHLTGANSGRLNTALVKPLHLPALRLWVTEHYEYTIARQVTGNAHSIYHNTQKASEGIAQNQCAAIQNNAANLSIVMSRDKDLAMCGGLLCDWDTYKIRKASASFSRLSMTEETRGNIALVACVVFGIIGILASIEPGGLIIPAIVLVIWFCRKVAGCFSSNS